MRRREFITLVGAAAASPLAARAQEPGRVYHLGSLVGSQRTAPYHGAFFEALRQSGFVEGQNLLADPHGYGLRVDQFAGHAAEVVDARVDVIICAGETAIRAAQAATKTIPILGGAENMVAAGLVRSLANPGGNTTGFSLLGSDLDGKRLDILMEVVPKARRVAVLTDGSSSSPQHLQMLEETARARGVEFSILQATRPEEIAIAIEMGKNSGVTALNVLGSAPLYVNRHLVLRSVATLGLPTIFPWPEASEEGGLMAYGPRLVQIYRDIWARQAIKLLRGAKPSELPIEQPTIFELIVNVKTAKALGLTISESFLTQADKVIE